jgi:hypothetical protein
MPVFYSPAVDPATLSPRQLASALQSALDAALPPLQSLTEADAARSPAAQKWSAKQILGHLIDSAVNNLHRFVRLQSLSELQFPGYQQEEWVAAGHYNERPWTELLALWESLNRHLIHVLAHTPIDHLGHKWIRDEGSLALGFIMQDYTGHLRHHLGQILPEFNT